MKTFSKEKIVFFHEGTLNGKAGAYAAYKVLQDTAQFEGIDYSTLDKLHEYDLYGKTVYVIGLSIAAKHLDPVCFSARKVIFIDHHKSTVNIIEDIPYSSRDKFQLLHNARRASCCLSWAHFIPDKPMPELYLAIEDIEMNNEPPRVHNSFYICSGLGIYPDFFSLTSFFQSNLDCLKPGESLNRLISSGLNNHKFLESLVKTYVSKASYYEILNKRLPVLNIPKTFVSSCLNELASKAGVALSYTDSGNSRYWSIRTHPESKMDAGKISALLEGGGSTNMGGFVTTTKVTPEDLSRMFRQALSENVNKDIILIQEDT